MIATQQVKASIQTSSNNPGGSQGQSAPSRHNKQSGSILNCVLLSSSDPESKRERNRIKVEAIPPVLPAGGGAGNAGSSSSSEPAAPAVTAPRAAPPAAAVAAVATESRVRSCSIEK